MSKTLEGDELRDYVANAVYVGNSPDLALDQKVAAVRGLLRQRVEKLLTDPNITITVTVPNPDKEAADALFQHLINHYAGDLKGWFEALIRSGAITVDMEKV